MKGRWLLAAAVIFVILIGTAFAETTIDQNIGRGTAGMKVVDLKKETTDDTQQSDDNNQNTGRTVVNPNGGIKAEPKSDDTEQNNVNHGNDVKVNPNAGVIVNPQEGYNENWMQVTHPEFIPVHKNTPIVVTIDVKDAQDLQSFGLDFYYNYDTWNPSTEPGYVPRRTFTIRSIEKGSLAGNALFDYNTGSGVKTNQAGLYTKTGQSFTGNVAYENISIMVVSPQPISGSGTVAVITFEPLDDNSYSEILAYSIKVDSRPESRYMFSFSDYILTEAASSSGKPVQVLPGTYYMTTHYSPKILDTWLGSTMFYIADQKKGDANGDGQITNADALIALEISIKKRPYDPVCDMNSDGKVTGYDVAEISKLAAGQTASGAFAIQQLVLGEAGTDASVFSVDEQSVGSSVITKLPDNYLSLLSPEQVTAYQNGHLTLADMYLTMPIQIPMPNPEGPRASMPIQIP